MNDLERTVITEIKNGQVRSFELVFRSYYPRLCKYAYSMIHDYDQSADIVKDFFIRWWENRNSWDIHISLSGFLFRSVHHASYNYLHREKLKGKIISESDLSSPLADLSVSLADENASSLVLTGELEKILNEAIGKLPDQCREIFILSRMEQLSHEEIAHKLGISANTVKVQIYRALVKMKVELKDFLPFLPFLLLR